MSWLSDLLDTKVTDLSTDPLGKEAADRMAARDADTKVLQARQAESDAAPRATEAKADPAYVDPTMPFGETPGPGSVEGAKPESLGRAAYGLAQKIFPLKDLPPEQASSGLAEVTADESQRADGRTLTPDAVAAAPAQQALSRSSHVRGGSPGAQVGGPVAEGELSSAPTKIDDDVKTALVTSGVDPRVAALVADQHRRRKELADAQAKQDWKSNIAMGYNDIDVGVGLANDSVMASRLKWAGQDVENVKAQQKAEDEALPQAEALRGFTRSVDADNKDSELSRETARVLGMKPGSIAASLAPDAMKIAQQRLEKYKVEHEDKRNETTQLHEDERNKLTNKTHVDVALINADARQRGQKSPELVAQQEKQLADIRGARAMIQKLDQEMETKGVSGAGSAVSALLGKLGLDTDAAEVDANAKLAARVVGRGVEGGKFSDQDAAFYNSIGARAGDARELQRAKNRAALQRLDEAEKQILGVAQQAGRSTGSLRPESSGAGQSAADAPVGTRRPGPGGQMYRKVGPGKWQAE